MAQDGRTLTGPDDIDGVVHASNVSAAEQAAWDVAVRLGLPVTRAELRTLLRAAEIAAGDTRMPGSGPAEGELRRWERILARHGVPGVTVLDVIEHGDGLQVRGRLGHAATRDMLGQAAGPVAVSKRLGEDAVTFGKPEDGPADGFVMHVRTRSGPREDVLLPEDNSPASISWPFPVGVTDNGCEFRLAYREITVLIAGPHGSGRTNLENVIIAQLARCTDTVIFRIDFQGGRSTRPWMLPWVQGQTPRPVIDWLATTREEADLMMDALIAGCAVRSRSGQGWEKITPSADVPAVILVASDNTVREPGLARKLAQYAEICRSEAMGLLRTGLRGGGIPAEVRIGLRATSAAVADSVFPDNHNAARALARLRNPGDGLVLAGQDMSPPVHFYRALPEKIREVALAAGYLRPALEDRLAGAMGAAYTERWSRPHGLDLVNGWRQHAGA